MITLTPASYALGNRDISKHLPTRLEAFFGNRGGVIMANSLRKLSYEWQTRQRKELAE